VSWEGIAKRIIILATGYVLDKNYLYHFEIDHKESEGSLYNILRG
jgi:hypothetical protein